MDIEKSIIRQCTKTLALEAFIASGIKGEHFADIVYGQMYDYAVEYYVTHGASIEAPSVDVMLAKFDEFPKFAEPANHSFLIDEFKNLMAKRGVVGILKDVAELIQTSPLEAAQKIQDEMGSIVEKASRKENKLVYGEDIVSQKKLEDDLVSKRVVNGVPYPYIELTAHTGGIREGEITIISAPPGTGKSWFCCHSALVAKQHGWNTYFATLEMDTMIMSQRINLIQCGKELETVVPPAVYTAGGNTDAYTEKIDRAREVIAGYPGKLVIEKPASYTVQSIFSNARKNGCNYVIIDQLQFIQRYGNRSRTEQIEQIINEIAIEARNHPSGKKIAVLLVSQLNREGVEETRHGKAPSMTSLAMSASLEQVADCVLAIGQTQEERSLNIANIVINKGRRFQTIGWQLVWRIADRALFHIAHDGGKPIILKT